MRLKEGKVVGSMPTNMRLPNGTKVMMDGTIMLGGKQMQLKEGEMMMRDGTMTEGGIPMKRVNQ